MNHPSMPFADRLSARLEELASAVHRAGVRSPSCERLLELAAAATVTAIELELRLSERNATGAAEPAPAQAS